MSNEKYLQFGSEFLKSFPGALARCIALREAKLTLDKLQSLKHAAINIGDRRQAGYLEYRAIPEKEAIIAAYERENRDTNSDENLIFGSTEVWFAILFYCLYEMTVLTVPDTRPHVALGMLQP